MSNRRYSCCRSAFRWTTSVTLLLLGSFVVAGCNQLKITPPKPNKIGRAGQGPALRLTQGEPTKHERDPQAELGTLMRHLDDEIAAWHSAYAAKDPMESLLEAGLTRRAEQHYDTLVRAVNGDNVPFAMVSATAVAFANRQETVPLLLAVARSDADSRIVKNALNGLGILASRNPIARQQIQGGDVSPLLADDRTEVRLAASFLAMNLVQRGDDQGLLPYLADCTGDANYMVRANSSWAIGRAALPGSVGLLEVTLHSDKVPEVRCNAALALAATANSAAVSVLIAGLRDPDESVRRHCVTALGLMTGQTLGQDEQAWTSWWATHREGFAPRVLDNEAGAPSGG